MKRFVVFATLGCAALALSACGSTDDASTEAMPETVEMPADEALAPISEEPVEDPDALEVVEDPAAEVAAEAVAASEASSPEEQE